MGRKWVRESARFGKLVIRGGGLLRRRPSAAAGLMRRRTTMVENEAIRPLSLEVQNIHAD